MSIKDLIQNKKIDQPNNKYLGETYQESLERGRLEAKEQGLKLLQEGKQNRADAMMKLSDVPLATKNIGNYVAGEKWQEDCVEIMANWTANAIKGKGNKFLILSGEYGSGKTHLGCAAINILKDSGMVGLARQFEAVIETLWNQKLFPQESYKLNQALCTADVLMLDEIGAGEMEISTAKTNKLGAILRTRVINNHYTVITTNWDLSELFSAIDSFTKGAIKEGGYTAISIAKGQGKDQRSGGDCYEV